MADGTEAQSYLWLIAFWISCNFWLLHISTSATTPHRYLQTTQQYYNYSGTRNRIGRQHETKMDTVFHEELSGVEPTQTTKQIPCRFACSFLFFFAFSPSYPRHILDFALKAWEAGLPVYAPHSLRRGQDPSACGAIVSSLGNQILFLMHTTDASIISLVPAATVPYVCQKAPPLVRSILGSWFEFWGSSKAVRPGTAWGP